jgi:general nucleoside transport system permease protein
MRPAMHSTILSPILVTLTITAIVLAVMMGIIVASGYDPGAAIGGLWEYSFGDMNAFANVLNRAMALILSGLAAVVAFRTGFFNIGGEGQILLGAMAAAIVGFRLPSMPPILHVLLAFLAGSAAGALGAFIPAILKTRLNVDEVITCIMLNSIYALFTGYLATYPFHDPTRWSGTTPQIASSAQLPFLVPSCAMSSGIIISIMVAGVLFVVMRHTDSGYRWKMTGMNPVFARYGGINVPATQLTASLISGALAGCTGVLLVCGTQYRFWNEIGTGIGWDGVLVAMLAMNNPIAVVIAGFMFAFLKTSSLGMEISSNVPSELINVILAFLILVITGRSLIVGWISRILPERREAC